MQPLSAWSEVRCDSVSPPYLWGLAVVAVGIALPCRLNPPRLWRLPALAVIGIAGVAALGNHRPGLPQRPLGPARADRSQRCGSRNVPEGLPVWQQSLPVIMMILGFPVIALFGSWRARARAIGEQRSDWNTLILLQLASIAIAIMVQRAGAVEAALALPSGAWLIATLTERAGKLEMPVTRIVATAAIILLLAPLTLPLLANVSFTHEKRAVEAVTGDAGCALPMNVARLDALPVSNIVSTFDLSATILSVTHHRVLATAHHRNREGMKVLVLAFTRPMAEGEALLKRRKIDYVAICRGGNEVRIFTKLGPGGLMDHLGHGQAPAWLRPVRIEGYPQISLWRVI